MVTRCFLSALLVAQLITTQVFAAATPHGVFAPRRAGANQSRSDPAAVAANAGTTAAQVKAAPAPITLRVDARDVTRKILHAELTFPARPGPLTLLYPKWIPGEHGPTGPITDLVNLRLRANNQSVPWQRDQADMFTFHCDVPAGASTLNVAFDFLLTANTAGFSSGASASAQLAVLNWNQLLLYPQGFSAANLTYQTSLRLPQGWQYGTALRVARDDRAAASIEFQPVSLERLVDSPLIAGANFRTVALTAPGTAPSFQIDMVSDSRAALVMSPEVLADYRQLVREAHALFGAWHYEQYHFLFTLSDQVANFGLEHHESSDDRVPERTLSDPSAFFLSASLLPHEFVHSWNGKYRRPADIATPEFQTPMRTELLWVYEGLTQYLGEVLTARSGLLPNSDSREVIAWFAAYLDNRPGREWRPLSDTATAAQLLYNAPASWASLRRSVDFYDEGVLIWLEADARIRQQTNGKRSLDDFCRRFHGGQSGPPVVKPYTFDDVVNTLNEVAPGDWRAFLNTRVRNVNPHAPLGGLENSGWRLVYNTTPNTYIAATEASARSTQMFFSLGFNVGAEGNLIDVIPGRPAERAGLSPGMKIIAINSRRFSATGLHDAVAAAKGTSEPVELLIENAEIFRVYRLDYHDGERYPHLERISNRPDLLTQIMKPLTPRAAASKNE